MKAIGKISFVVLQLVLVFVSAFGQIRLPRLVSDGMVLQRDAEVKIWGWAEKHEEITLRFLDSTYKTVAGDDGAWSLLLPRMQAGGPYEMLLSASNVVKLNNIVIGDVWVCSGQSNMELSVRRASPLYGDEIADSENPFIRQFLVPQRFNFVEPLVDFPTGSWKHANPENVLSFSAVAYFFARELYNLYRVPIGLINTSLGGSPAEAWMSEEALRLFPTHFKEAQRFKDSTLIREIETQDNRRIHAWYTLLRQRDEGYKEERKPWYDPSMKTSDWTKMNIPGYWADGPLGPTNGVVWFRKEITIPALMAGKQAKLNLGRLVDADSVFLNGIFVGTTSYQYPPRRYVIPSGLLKEGKNVLVVRLINSWGRGGFVPDKPYEIAAGDAILDLKGEWQYRLGATMEPLASQTFIRWKPVGLHNAMLSPLFNYRIKGVIWYQGESNANRPVEYQELFPAMIRDWRNQWKQGDFPFLFVQLPNFMQASDQPTESNWALLREAQLKTLAIPNTGMAVTIDIGEWNDIHPLNKKDVGKRLALAAQGVAYADKNVVSSGPMFDSMRIDSNKVILSFSNIGTGLVAKGGGELRSFALASADKKYVWAHAKTEGNTVIVWSDAVANPVAVRYAWADNPDTANLYNKEGLPASPFRTDDWPSK